MEGEAMKPMKYSSVDDPDLVTDLLDDSNWTLEQKMDGTRGWALLRPCESAVMVTGLTEQGEPLPLRHTAATQHLSGIWNGLRHIHAMLSLGESIILDGEVMIDSGEFRVFDVPLLTTATSLQVSPATYQARRREVLDHLAQFFTGSVSAVRQAVTAADKRALLHDCRSRGVEGVVFKYLRGNYVTTGKRTDQVLKHKFVKTADVVVIREDRGRNAAGREVGSISFAVVAPPEWSMTPQEQQSVLLLAPGVPPLLPMGSCSVIGKPHVELGDVIEVAYLYRPATGGLIQPRMVRTRPDKSPDQCGMDQFAAYSREVVS
jgi:hypothetical protein